MVKLPSWVQPPSGYDISRLFDFAMFRRYEEATLKWENEEAQDA